MTGSIQIPFALGEQIWWASGNPREVWVTCPECAGTKVLTLILGNGEKAIMDCGYCGTMLDRASGTVREYKYECEPLPFTPRRVGISGAEFTYSEADPEATSYSYAYVKDLFADKEACAVRCAELNAERAENQRRQQIANLESKRQHLAFSVSYWRNQVKDMEQKLGWAKERLAKSIEIKAMKPMEAPDGNKS